MKKTILGLGLVAGIVIVAGCGNAATSDVNGESMNTGGGQQVTKQQINDVQQKMQETKAKALKIQMDDSLTKEQKAQKIEALQMEIQAMANTK